MKLIIILICLALERYLNFGQYLNRFFWLDKYLDKLQPLLNKVASWGRPIQLAIVILPLPIIIGLLHCLLSMVLFGIFSFIIGIAVLLYCFGPEDLFEQVNSYTTASESYDIDEMKSVGERLIATDCTEEEEESNRAITESLFIQSNDRYFAVLFWFLILGPFGAILYRMVSLMSRHKHSDLAAIAESFLRILDLIPVRLVSFSYLLVGQFTAGFNYWFEHLLDGLNANDEMLTNVGLAAAGNDINTVTELQADDVARAINLVDRSLYVWVVVVALVTLGAWLF